MVRFFCERLNLKKINWIDYFIILLSVVKLFVYNEFMISCISVDFNIIKIIRIE